MVKNLKQKGKSFESKIADMIHQHFLLNDSYRSLFESLKNDNLKPQRDESSGASIKSTGDISLGIAQSYFPYSIECKNWDSLTELALDSIMKDKIKTLIKVWTEQVVPKANQCKLKPLLIFKGTRTGNYCIFRTKDIEDKSKALLAKVFISYHDLTIYKFEDFLELHL